jgi:hypothetical protein
MSDGTSRHFAAWLLALFAAFLLVAAAPLTTTMTPDIAMPILGRTVYGSSGDTVGRIVDVLVDAAGLPQAAVLDVGGFLGLGNRTIAVHWGTLHFHPSDKDHPITIDMPADEIKAAPAYDDTTAPAQVVVPHTPPADALGTVAKPLATPPAAAPPAASTPTAPAAAPPPSAPPASPAAPSAPPAAPSAPPLPTPAPPTPAPPTPAPPTPAPPAATAAPDAKK